MRGCRVSSSQVPDRGDQLGWLTDHEVRAE